VTRSVAAGRPLFCDKACSGMAHRNAQSVAARKAWKADYDREYREANREKLKAAKAARHKATYDPEKARIERKRRAPKHLEYCRQPEYRAWKAEYDRDYRAQRYYGDFAEAYLILQELEGEIRVRVPRHELKAQHGTLNKWIERRRAYDRDHSTS